MAKKFCAIENNKGIPKRSNEYNDIFARAHECVSILNLICDSIKPENTSAPQYEFSCADEIMKFIQLLDQGIITQDEFDTKRSSC